MKYYFFECKREKDELHVYPLPGQLKGDMSIDPKKKLRCSRHIRVEGMIYGCLEIYSSTSGYYTTGGHSLFRLDFASESIKKRVCSFYGRAVETKAGRACFCR